ncbi:hypothetical protein [Achromobacter marplatensis]|uniref:Uncharacterized protein n=1 Tax=Achromobacter marplatensis TaxID=470868 RepID=A0AA43B457_9BURK|nr:hypothetical protein [Achromobacter marplatensis]MDH2053372.1 hypothetical protein [Achromobacter marplatensis]
MTDKNNAALASAKEIHKAFELSYAMDADDPANASDLSHFTNGWRACIMSQVRAEGVRAGDEWAAFEADYAKAWNAAYENKTSHTAEEVAALREGDGYGEENVYLNARWRGWQARAALASAPVAGDAQQNDETLRLVGVIADKIEDGTLFNAGIYSRRDLADKVRAVLRLARQGVQPAAPQASEAVCSCPTGDGSLRHPCAVHPPGEKDGGHGSDQAPPQSPPQNRTEALHG